MANSSSLGFHAPGPAASPSFTSTPAKAPTSQAVLARLSAGGRLRLRGEYRRFTPRRTPAAILLGTFDPRREVSHNVVKCRFATSATSSWTRSRAVSPLASAENQPAGALAAARAVCPAGDYPDRRRRHCGSKEKPRPTFPGPRPVLLHLLGAVGRGTDQQRHRAEVPPGNHRPQDHARHAGRGGTPLVRTHLDDIGGLSPTQPHRSSI